jgi:hypothetical protein
MEVIMLVEKVIVLLQENPGFWQQILKEIMPLELDKNL